MANKGIVAIFLFANLYLISHGHPLHSSIELQDGRKDTQIMREMGRNSQEENSNLDREEMNGVTDHTVPKYYYGELTQKEMQEIMKAQGPGIEEGSFEPVPMPFEFEVYDVKPRDGLISRAELTDITGAMENVDKAFEAADKDGNKNRLILIRWCLVKLDAISHSVC